MGVPRSEVRARLQALRRCLHREHLSGLYVSQPADVHYLSGFTGSDSALLLTSRGQWLITDSRYTEEAADSAPLFEVVTWKKQPTQFAGELAKRSRIRSLGFNAQHVSVAAHKALRRGARNVRLETADALVAELRAIKSAWEVRQIRKALRCAEGALRGIRKRLRPGQTETDVRLDLEWEMRKRGAADAAFETIVAAGANASRPHAHAGTRRLRRGGLLLIDFGARLGPYNCDLTRVLFLGSIPKLWKHRYELVLKAQEQGIQGVCPGAAGHEADEAARAVFRAAGCAEHFSHSLGHGVGLAVHEAPRLGQRVKARLRPGMVVTVEPGLYYPRRGGIRIEDMVLVTATGKRCLSALEKDLDWAVI